MPVRAKTLRTCEKGHSYYKSSDCPVCLQCEEERKPEKDFLALLSAPARRALEHEGITTLQQLSRYSEKEILQLHGMGKSSIIRLTALLKAKGMKFRVTGK